MWVLHAHWQPPCLPADAGEMLFWVETSEAPPPPRRRGRLSQRPAPKDHPFCMSHSQLSHVPGLGGHLAGAEATQILLRLPSTRTGPRPSPGLLHDWELDEETAPFLAPWRVNGLSLPARRALEVLIHLPPPDALAPQGTLSAEVPYWRTAAGLVLETLAAQKIVPVLAPADDKGRVFHARWLPVLDSTKDAARLARLEAAMPPICRAEIVGHDEPLSPQSLLDTFLKTMSDALARHWGRSAATSVRFIRRQEALGSWLTALFHEDPEVHASAAQLDALARSHQAWMRNLHVAGDAAFCVAFRLEAPAQPVEPSPDDVSESGQEDQWQLHYLLQARDDASLLVPAHAVWKTRGNVLKQLGRRFEQPQEKLLAGLGYAARLFSPIASSLKTARPDSMSLDTPQAYAFLREAAPLLTQAGFSLLTPPWWNRSGARLGARLRMRPTRSANTDAISHGKLSFENLIHYEWEVSLGDTTLSQKEFQALVALKSPLVRIRGQWVRLDAEQVEAAIHFWEKQRQTGEIDLQDALAWGLTAEGTFDGLPVNEVVTEGWLSDWLARLTQHEKLEELPQPNGLQGQLRPYQCYGYSWLNFLRRWGLGACLADDMGLGKTVQTLALLLREKEETGQLPGPTLLICPTSVVTNWEREVRRFTPSLTVWVHQGANRLRDEEFVQAAQSADLVLTSYAVVRRDAEVIRTVPWLGVILDEAQNIKNPSAKQTQAVRQIHADFRVALTGTPVENRLSELWSIMHFLNPNYLGSRQKFREQFALPIERYKDEEATRRLKKIVAPFILRRVKTDPRVIQDLPEKLETKDYCSLTEEQATLYESVVEDSLRKVEENEGFQRRGLVLSMLMQLKQICNHPVQYLHQVDAKGNELADVAGRSGKLARLIELLEEVVSVGDRALIFTQFAEMGHILRAYLPEAVGCPTQFLHGGVPAAKRDQLVQSLSGRGSRPDDLHPVDQSRRHWPEPDAGQSRLPLRPLVESGGGGSGDGSGLPHRPEAQRAGAQVRHRRARSKR